MIQVISLIDAKFRRESVADVLNQAGVEFQFFDAYRDNCQLVVEELTQGERNEVAMFKLLFGSLAPLSPGEIGCATSHVSVLSNFLKSDEDWLCVLEDDIVLNDEVKFKAVLQDAKDGKLDADFIYLGAFRRTVPPNFFRQLVLLFIGTLRILCRVNRFSRQPRNFTPYVLQSIRECYPWPARLSRDWMKAGIHDGSHAYLLTKKAARLLVSWNRAVDFRADELLGFAQFMNLMSMIIPKSSIVSQRLDFPSQIGNNPHSRQP